MAILSFQKPDKIVLQKANDFEGVFEFRPLEPGYGNTIGNALRRVLLSSLEGYAIVGIKIEGVDHEFATIHGVTEDVTEMILNLKQVRFKLKNDSDITSEKINISIKGKSEFVAGDIEKATSPLAHRIQTHIEKLKTDSFHTNNPIELSIIKDEYTDIEINLISDDKQEYKGEVEEISSSKSTLGLHAEETIVAITPPEMMPPGDYDLEIIDSNGSHFEQEITWGVLALNTNKATYSSGETVDFEIAVLDKAGAMVCDAECVYIICVPFMTGAGLTSCAPANSCFPAERMLSDFTWACRDSAMAAIKVATKKSLFFFI